MSRRIFYVQYTNPAGYPPLLHSARLLATAGWRVDLLGVSFDEAEIFHEPDRPGMRFSLRRTPPEGRGRQVDYLRFVARVLARIRAERPEWVYASDLFAAPVALLAKRLFGTRVVYHEHDAPDLRTPSMVMRAVLAARRLAVRQADLVVAPNAERLARLLAEAGSAAPSVCVWNCPGRDEIGEARSMGEDSVTLYYHGTLNPSRLPESLLDALTTLPPHVQLRAVGYETSGSRGYRAAYLAAAAERGLAARVSVGEPVAERRDLLAQAHQADIGLALVPLVADDYNLETMTGASNKPFDYLSQGLALVVSARPDWQAMFEAPGYAVSADPSSGASIAAALRPLCEDVSRARSMGEAGRQRVLGEWNYEAQFQPVLDMLEGTSRSKHGTVSSFESILNPPAHDGPPVP